MRTVVTGAGDALAAAEAYDQEAHEQATQALGKGGGLLYETLRTGVLPVFVGPVIYNRLP